MYPDTRVGVIDDLNETAHGQIEVDFFYLPLVENFINIENHSHYQKTVISVVIETVYEVPKFIQNKYPQSSISIAEKNSLILPTLQMISFDHEFVFLQDEKNLITKNLTFRSAGNNAPIAIGTIDLDTENVAKKYSTYQDMALSYYEDRYREKNLPQIMCKVGIRVRRAVGKINYENIPVKVEKKTSKLSGFRK